MNRAGRLSRNVGSSALGSGEQSRSAHGPALSRTFDGETTGPVNPGTASSQTAPAQDADIYDGARPVGRTHPAPEPMVPVGVEQQDPWASGWRKRLARALCSPLGLFIGRGLWRLRLLSPKFAPRGGREVVIYRGIGPGCKIEGAYEEAARGVAVPANQSGKGSLSSRWHIRLGAGSRFTSWTTDLGMAQHAASHDAPGGGGCYYNAYSRTRRTTTFPQEKDGRPQFILAKTITELELRWLRHLRGCSWLESEVLLLDTQRAERVLENRPHLILPESKPF